MSHNKFLAFAQSFYFICLAKSPTDKKDINVPET